MKPIILTQLQARQFILAYQGLQPSLELTGKSGVLEYIRRVGCIQYDPLDIVGHNPELVLQARVAGFHPAMLQELLYSDRKLLDGWDKMMAVYPVEDWPYFRRQREAAREYFGNSSRPVVAVLPQVRQAIEAQGPLSSIDLQLNEIVDWPWAPTRLSRAALESMYFWGELVIHHKVHTRKVYDFARRHLPFAAIAVGDGPRPHRLYHGSARLDRMGGDQVAPAILEPFEHRPVDARSRQYLGWIDASRVRDRHDDRAKLRRPVDGDGGGRSVERHRRSVPKIDRRIQCDGIC